jgi:hypothetical protein
MSRLWTRLFASVTLLAIGALIGSFYTDRQYRHASEAPLVAESYVRHSACPTQTLSRVNEVLAEDGIAVPPKARETLRTKRETLIAEICPPGRREATERR